MTIDKIYLSQESENQELDFDHLNTEVIVLSDDGNKYRASFICIPELERKISEDQEIKKNVAKKYFWSRSLVIVSNIKKGDLLPMVEYMIEEGDFQLIFEKM